jgi:hypothetical protein
MTKKETATSLASASADARRQEIRAEMDQARDRMTEIMTAHTTAIENLARTLNPLAQSIAQLATEAQTTLDALSHEAKSSLNAVQTTAASLPSSHTAAVKQAAENLEKRATSLISLVTDVSSQAKAVSSYANQVDQRQRRSHLTLAVGVGLITALPPTLIGLAVGLAAGMSPVRLLSALLPPW